MNAPAAGAPSQAPGTASPLFCGVDCGSSEIKAHLLGVQHQLRLERDYTIIDIGGQDAKVIRATPGRVDQFAINRRCAAGTGAYIEELAHRLEVPLESLPGWPPAATRS